MKKLLFLLLPIMAFSQEKALTTSGKYVILNNDHTWKFEEKQNSGLNSEDFKTTKDNITAGLLNKVKIPVQNGEDKLVNVDFSYISKVDQFNKISYDKIQKMIDNSRNYIMLRLKNKLPP